VPAVFSHGKKQGYAEAEWEEILQQLRERCFRWLDGDGDYGGAVVPIVA
jgi:hypothetical protein